MPKLSKIQLLKNCCRFRKKQHVKKSKSVGSLSERNPGDKLNKRAFHLLIDHLQGPIT